MPQNLPASPEYEHMNSSMSMKLYHNHLLKRSIQLVITLSLFSLLICLTTINSNPFFFSSFCTHTLERKYMFLICNAILAFLSTRKTTTTTSSSASDHDDDMDSVVKEVGCDHQDAAMFEGGTSEEETEESRELDGEGDDQDGGSNDDEDQVGDELEEEGEEEEEKGSWEMEAEEEEGGGKSSEEEMMELNRKIEDFIRKMKQEMRIESQQPLVAAV